MPVTLEFTGLCAFVTEVADAPTSTSLDVLLVDAIPAGADCAHEAKLILPAANLEDPDNLTTPDPPGGSDRKLNLSGKKLRFLPGGQFPGPSTLQTANLHLIPEMKQVCGIGTVDSGCFSTPPTKPIAARVELPGGGRFFCNPIHATTEEWSFAPPVVTCYHGRFSWVVQVELPAADHVVIEVESNLAVQALGRLTLRTTDSRLSISNLCTEAPIGTPSDDTLVYFALLNPPFSGNRPMARDNPNCQPLVLNYPGIGCIPFLLSRA